MSDDPSPNDFFAKVKAPCWVNLVDEANADLEEADDSFFAELVEKEVVQGMAQLATDENAEDLSRLAMFGKKPQIKRRSQIRREQGIANNQSIASARPSEPLRRTSSLNRSTSVSRQAAATASGTRTTGPLTRSQTRGRPAVAATSNPTSIPAATANRSRSLQRNEVRSTTANRRAPVMVRSPPRPASTFGSTLRLKAPEPRTNVLRPRQGLSNGSNPPTSGLRAPTTPTSASHISRPGTGSVRIQNSSSHDPPVRRNLQEMIQRLSTPKNNTTTAMQTPTRKIPNTYTHGLHSVKVRRHPLPDTPR